MECALLRLSVRRGLICCLCLLCLSAAMPRNGPPCCRRSSKTCRVRTTAASTERSAPCGFSTRSSNTSPKAAKTASPSSPLKREPSLLSPLSSLVLFSSFFSFSFSLSVPLSSSSFFVLLVLSRPSLNPLSSLSRSLSLLSPRVRGRG